MDLEKLNAISAAVRAVAPIDGMQIGNLQDKTTWEIFFSASATTEQRAAAAAALDNFDVSAPTPYEVRLAQFLADNDRVDIRSKLAGATPAQIKAYVTANVTDLASARILLMKILLLLAMEMR